MKADSHWNYLVEVTEQTVHYINDAGLFQSDNIRIVEVTEQTVHYINPIARMKPDSGKG